MTGTILIVDDEEEIRAVVTEYLEGKGYSVFEAATLGQARKHLKSGLQPDLVVLDVVLSDGNGVGFLQEIRSAMAPRDVPVIMISAHRTTSNDKASGLEGGADDYVAKPFDLKELGLRINRLVHPKGKRGWKRGGDDREEEPPLTDAEKTSNLIRVVLGRHGGLPEFPEPKSAAAPTAKPQEEAAEPDLPEPETLGASVSKTAKIFVHLLVEPKIVISKLATTEFRVIAYGSLVLAGVFSAIQKGIEAKSVATAFVNSLMLPTGYAAVTGGISWTLQWIMGLRKKSVKFKDVFIGLSTGFAPIMIAAALGILYVGFSGGRSDDFTAGLLLIMPSQASSKYLGALLRRVDLFEIWAVWLAARGLHARIGGRVKNVLVFSFGVWIFVVLIIAGVQGYFS